MNGDTPLSRRDELLADRALAGLDSAEQAEFEELFGADALDDLEAFERTAAELAVGLAAASLEPLPDHLRQRLAAQGHAFTAGVEAASLDAPALAGPATFAERRFAAEDAAGAEWSSAAEPRPYIPGVGPAGDAVAIPTAAASEAEVAESASEAGFIWGWLGWAVAVVLLLGIGLPQFFAASLETRLAQAPDRRTAAWTSLPGFEQAKGEVVWSNQLQAGYMVFENLAPNDPNRSQYQLWIFDKNQDERHPIDGGVFDVTSSGKVIVPITPKLRVGEAYQFAVTAEKPGGVVVSSREKLVVLAKAE